MMKSVLCLVVAIAMLASLCACGSKPSETPDNSANTNTDTNTDTNTNNDGSESKPAPTSKCVTVAAEGSEYIYDSVTIGTGVFGNFIPGTAPAETDNGCSLVFDVVFKVDPDTKEIYSDILEDWHWEDESTLIMKLKDGIYFSNGEKATAEDLLYTYTSHRDRSSAYLTEIVINTEKTEIRDELTLAMNFDQFYSGFYAYKMYLIDKSWSESVGWDSLEWLHPVGSGAYECTDYVNGDHITFVARDDYWNKENNPVKVREWVLKYYSDSSTMAMDLELGNIALCTLQSVDYERFLNNGGDGYDVYAGPSGVCFIFNFGFLENECWYDKRVREAFAYGIPWEEFGQVTLGVNYSKATGFVPSTSPDYQDVGTYTYDLDKAKALLADAGYNESNPLKLHTVMFDTSFYSKSCEAFEYYCSQLGVEFTYDLKDIPAAVVDWNTLGGGCELGFNFNNLGSPTQLFVSSVTFAATRDGCKWAFIDDKEFDDMYIATSNESNEAKRVQIAKDAQQRMHDEVLAIPYSEATFQVGYRTDVFTLDQMRHGVMCGDYYNLTTMSQATNWQ